MNDWSPPQRPSEYVEQILVTSILDGTFPAGSSLPGERELAEQLGITRPTLREVLRHLASDGWLIIRQGKPTQVNNIWQDGGLNVLNSLVHYAQYLPPNFVPNLLEVRLALAPVYARAAVTNDPLRVAAYLEGFNDLQENPSAYATFDWHLHHVLTIASGNPIFTLILNGFTSFYERMAALYFNHPRAREASHDYYRALHQAIISQDAQSAEEITRHVMQLSMELWQEFASES